MNAPYGAPQHPHPYPHPQPPAPKKSGRGCLIALAIAGGILLLGGIAVAVALYLVATSADGKKVIGIVGGGIEMTQEALNAPGTKELRALGCKEAMVMDFEKFATWAATFSDAGPPKTSTPSGVRVMVTCSVGVLAKPPSCGTVASTYKTAVGTPAGKYMVNVTRSGGGSRPECTGVYDVDGSEVTDAGASSP